MYNLHLMQPINRIGFWSQSYHNFFFSEVKNYSVFGFTYGLKLYQGH